VAVNPKEKKKNELPIGALKGGRPEAERERGSSRKAPKKKTKNLYPVRGSHELAKGKTKKLRKKRGKKEKAGFQLTEDLNNAIPNNEESRRIIGKKRRRGTKMGNKRDGNPGKGGHVKSHPHLSSQPLPIL